MSVNWADVRRVLGLPEPPTPEERAAQVAAAAKADDVRARTVRAESAKTVLRAILRKGAFWPGEDD